MKKSNSDRIFSLAREEATVNALIVAANVLANVQFGNRSKEIFKEKSSLHELSKKIEEFRKVIVASVLADTDKVILSALNDKHLYDFAREMLLESIKKEIPKV